MKAFNEYKKLRMSKKESAEIETQMSNGDNRIIDAFLAGYEDGAHSMYYAAETNVSNAYHSKMKAFRE